MEIVLLGHMGRDEALADRLYEDHTLHVMGQWENPGLAEKAAVSGGEYQTVDSVTNVEAVANYVEAVRPEMFVTNFDDALAAGVVDAIRRRVQAGRLPDLLIASPDREAAQVEWDKFFLRPLVDEIDGSFNPENFMVTDAERAGAAVRHFEASGREFAVKPRNLTGGKGVQVQGKHFLTHDDGLRYARTVLCDPRQTGLEIQEKLDYPEFTLQLITDGATMIEPPVTYDYPYREDGDTGPGTGGMGAFSMRPGEHLPFVDRADYDAACGLMKGLLAVLAERGLDYKGVLYPTFFRTPQGLKIVEVNARGGDPEYINILDLMEDDVDMADVLVRIARGELRDDSVRYKNMASAMIYLVSPDYGYRRGPAYEFGMDPALAGDFGCKVRFAAAERIDGKTGSEPGVRAGQGHYQTVGSSRSVGISSLAETPWAARANIHRYIKAGFDQPLPLAYRQDVGDEAYIQALTPA